MRQSLRSIAVIITASLTMAFGVSMASAADTNPSPSPTTSVENTAPAVEPTSPEVAPASPEVAPTSPEVTPTSPEQAPATGGVTEVRDGSGNVVGYQVDESTRAALNALDQQLRSQDAGPVLTAQGALLAVDWWQFARCTASSSSFLEQQVFPTAHAAELAVRLGDLVRTHGVEKAAQIIHQTYPSSDGEAEAIRQELTKQAAGVRPIEVCFA